MRHEAGRNTAREDEHRRRRLNGPTREEAYPLEGKHTPFPRKLGLYPIPFVGRRLDLSETRERHEHSAHPRMLQATRFAGSQVSRRLRVLLRLFEQCRDHLECEVL